MLSVLTLFNWPMFRADCALGWTQGHLKGKLQSLQDWFPRLQCQSTEADVSK